MQHEKHKKRTLSGNIISQNITSVEVAQFLKAVMSGYSFDSYDDMKEIFWYMYPDSKVGKKITVGCTRMGNVLKYGLWP